MNRDSQLIKSALDRRFARAGTPSCPEKAWRVDATSISRSKRAAAPSRRFAYVAVFVALAVVATLGAKASNAVREDYVRLMTPFFVSTESLAPGIHATERLSMAQAQRLMPFTIVDPAGLPDHTRLLYAHVLSKAPPRIALSYETRLESKYYRVSIEESTDAPSSPVAHFNVQLAGRHTFNWTLPTRTWKHGSLYMTLFAWRLPADLSQRIERANVK